MSEPENFLTRWSRRKREQDSAPAPAAGPREVLDPKPQSGVAEKTAPDSRVRENEQEEEAGQPDAGFDLSKLPSLDSITASTDVRVFLQKGVPAELTRAALRRAWTSDPTIRDFIEVAENQWDFATGSDIPGFGPIEQSPEEIQRMVSSMFEAPAPAPPEDSSAKAESPGPAETDARGTSSDDRPEEARDTPALAASEPHDETPENIATQQETLDPNPLPPTRKRHGSAVPE